MPDGDTGTNMSMTIGAAAKEMAVLPENCTVEEAASRCASALLRGARGNSGVILSLIFRGFPRHCVAWKKRTALPWPLPFARA